MRRFLFTAVLCAGAYFAGYEMNSNLSLKAQETVKPSLTLLEGKGMYWSGDDLKKFVEPGKGTLIAATPIYRLNMWMREYYPEPKMTRVSKMMSHWDDAEMHEDKTQVYIIISGTGTVVLGGQAEKEQSNEGQHSGGPIKGGTAYKVKAGDWLLIPPKVWHQAQPDPGGLVYGMVHMQTATRMP